MKKTLLTLLLVMFTGISWAQSGWEEPDSLFKEGKREEKQNFTLDLKNNVKGAEYEIAAFINNELRGYTKEENSIYLYLTDEEYNSIVSFKLYDPESGLIYPLEIDEKKKLIFDNISKKPILSAKLPTYFEANYTKGEYIPVTVGKETNIMDYMSLQFYDDDDTLSTAPENYTIIWDLDKEDNRNKIPSTYLDIKNDIATGKTVTNKPINVEASIGKLTTDITFFVAEIIDSITVEDAQIYLGTEGYTPTAKIYKGESEITDATFSLSVAEDETVVKIENNNIVPLKTGIATVTAKCNEEETVTTTFTVTVISALDSVTVSNDSIEFTRNANGEIEITELPKPVFNWIAEAPEAAKTDESYTLASSDPAVIEIREGKAISLKEGFADITYTSVYDDTKSATFTVEAIQGISSIAIADSTIYYGTEGYTPIAKIYKGEAEVTDATFSLSVAEDETVVKIEDNKIVPLKTGTATVTAKCNEAENVTTEFTVTVNSALESLTLSNTSIEFTRTTEGDEEITGLPTLTLKWKDDAPAAIKNESYTLTSNDPAVIEIIDGKLVSKKEGTVVITFTSDYDATKSAALTIKVKQTVVKFLVKYDFEEGIPGNIILKDLDGLTPYKKLDYPAKTAWRVVTDPNDEMNQVIQSCSYYEGGGTANDWFVIPKVKLPANADDCKLFWRSRSAYDTYKDGYTIYVTTEEITSSTDFEKVGWKRLTYVTKADNPATWTSRDCDMAQYAGQEVTIAFNNSTSDGWYLYIDDITICSRENLPKGSVKITSSKYAKEGAGVVKARFKCGMFDNVYKFDARLVIEDGTITSNQQFKKTIAPNGTYEFTMSALVNGTAGEVKNYRLEIIDSETDNCYASADGQFIFIKDLKESKKVVAETYVNNDNGYSLQAIEGYKLMASEPWFIGLQLHGDKNGYEPMTPKNEAAYKQLITETYNIEDGRTVLIDRVHTGEAYNNISELSNNRNKEHVLVKADIKGVTYSDKIVVETSTIFALNSENTDCSYSFILTEDNVVNTQRNMYYGGGYGSFNGYETMDLFVNVSFNDVVRKTYSGVAYSKDVLTGDTVKNTFKLDIPENILVPANLKMTMIITDNNTGEILNAARCALTNNGGTAPDITGIEDNMEDGTISIENGNVTYTGYSTVKVQVYTTLGELVGTGYGDGNVTVTLPEQRGIYIVEINDGCNTFIKKVMR